MKTQYLCFPVNTKPTTTTTTTTTNPTTSTSSPATNGPLSPRSSLLNRFRNAVFRLIMVTALSRKATTNNKKSSLSSKPSSNNNRDYYRNNSNLGQDSVRRSCYLYDPYHSEALADCIEFIKKKSATASPSDLHYRLHDDHGFDYDDDKIPRDSIVSNEMVIPLPVM